jgi:serine/threonine-protein kinase HipA
MKCEIEIFLNNQWQTIANFDGFDTESHRGYSGSGILLYDVNYVVEHMGATDIRALSCNYPVNFELEKTRTWPAFMLDLLPAGAGRQALLKQFALEERGAKADWFLLLNGAGNPPGNLRIKEAAQQLNTENKHPGFELEEVISRQSHFIEYALEHGAPIAGSSGAQGDAPKFLLTQDKNNRWHADGTLQDTEAKKHWLVKFPRGHRKSDQLVLQHEYRYYFLAKAMGLRVHSEPIYKHNTLIIPRFDRIVTENEVIRLGQESLCSAMNIADFGVRVPLEHICVRILEVCTHPIEELIEFLKRDILNTVLGNTDNHSRNTSLQKLTNGSIRLTPLYDFAPMILDEEGIVRSCRWTGFDNGGSPQWEKIIKMLVKNMDLDKKIFINSLKEFSEKLFQLPKFMKTFEVDAELIERFEPKILDTANKLRSLHPD